MVAQELDKSIITTAIWNNMLFVSPDVVRKMKEYIFSFGFEIWYENKGLVYKYKEKDEMLKAKQDFESRISDINFMSYKQIFYTGCPEKKLLDSISSKGLYSLLIWDKYGTYVRKLNNHIYIISSPIDLQYLPLSIYAHELGHIICDICSIGNKQDKLDWEYQANLKVLENGGKLVKL